MEKATVGDGARTVNQNPELTLSPEIMAFVQLLVGQLVTALAGSLGTQPRGIPRDRYCHTAEILEFMKWDRRTWNMLREAGLPTDRGLGKSEHVDTNKLIDFLGSSPNLSSAKAKIAARKEAKRNQPKKRVSRKKGQ